MSDNSWKNEYLLYVKALKENLGFSYLEISKELKKTFKIDKSISAIEKAYLRYGKHMEGDETISKALDKEFKALKKLKESTSTLKNVISVKSETTELYEGILNTLKKNVVLKHKISVPKKKKPTTRTIVAHLSDTHYGVEIRKKELGNINEFNPLIAARRTAFLFREIAEYKKDKRDITDLVLVLNGDLIAGVIHDQEWGVLPLSSQFHVILTVLSQGISYLANHYSNITVIGTSGNHGRMMHKSSKDRAMNMKWDSFETMLFDSLRTTFNRDKNIEFILEKTPYSIRNIQGHNFFITHGDTVINVGNVSQTINVKKIESQINVINASLDKKIDVVMLGHLHKNTRQTLDNGVELMINGTLSGTDSYANALGIFGNFPSQQIFEVTPKHSVGDFRFVKLKDADNDNSLDKIIKPNFSLIP